MLLSVPTAEHHCASGSVTCPKTHETYRNAYGWQQVVASRLCKASCSLCFRVVFTEGFHCAVISLHSPHPPPPPLFLLTTADYRYTAVYTTTRALLATTLITSLSKTHTHTFPFLSRTHTHHTHIHIYTHTHHTHIHTHISTPTHHTTPHTHIHTHIYTHIYNMHNVSLCCFTFFFYRTGQTG